MEGITPTKLLQLINGLKEAETIKEDAKVIEKDTRALAKSMGIEPKVLTTLYKAYKDPEEFRESQHLINSLTQTLNI